MQIVVEFHRMLISDATDFINDRVLRHDSFLDQLLMCTNDGRFVAGRSAGKLDFRSQHGVGDVSAIPGEKIIDTVNSGH